MKFGASPRIGQTPLPAGLAAVSSAGLAGRIALLEEPTPSSATAAGRRSPGRAIN